MSQGLVTDVANGSTTIGVSDGITGLSVNVPVTVSAGVGPTPGANDAILFKLSDHLPSMSSAADYASFAAIVGTPQLELNYDGLSTRALRTDFRSIAEKADASGTVQITQSVSVSPVGTLGQNVTPVTTTLAQTVTGSTSSQTVTLTSAAGLSTGSWILLANNSYTASDMVNLTAVSGNNVTGIFTASYSNGATVYLPQAVTFGTVPSGLAANGYCAVGTSNPQTSAYEYVPVVSVVGSTVTAPFFGSHSSGDPAALASWVAVNSTVEMSQNGGFIGDLVPEIGVVGKEERVVVNPVVGVDRVGNRILAVFTIAHSANVSLGVDRDALFSGKLQIPFSPIATEIYAQIKFHPGKTASGGGLGTTGLFEYYDTIAQTIAGHKPFFFQQPDLTSTTTLSALVTGSGSQQTIHLTSTAFLIQPTGGSPSSQYISFDAGTTWLTVANINHAANTVDATVAGSYSNGAAVSLKRPGSLIYPATTGPSASATVHWDADTTPYKGSGNSWPLVSPPSLDSFIGTDYTITAHIKCESVPNANDAVLETWINGTKYQTQTGFQFGPNGFNNIEVPSVFRSPKYDMSLYTPEVLIWETGKTPSAPSAPVLNWFSTTSANITLACDKTDTGGAATVIHPYVYNGSTWVKNGGGVSDITLTADPRISGSVTFTHTGLTTGTAYRVKYTLANGIGESGQSAEVDFTPAFVAWTRGWNFRQALAGATDATNYVWSRATASQNVYPYTYTFTGGATSKAGWNSIGGMDDRDRSGTVARMEGMGFTPNNGTLSEFYIDLPISGGVYDISICGSDATQNVGGQSFISVYDGTTLLFSISPNLNSSGAAYNTAGTVFASQGAWSDSTRSITASGNLLKVKVGGTGTTYSVISSIYLNRTS